MELRFRTIKVAKVESIYLRSFSPSEPDNALLCARRLSANFLSDSEALAGRFHDF